MTGMLLIGLASLGVVTADVQSTSTAAPCRVEAVGPTFGLGGGQMYFHFNTTCDDPMESITIYATIDGPTQDRSGTKTCTQASSCSYVLGVTYARGTWVWTNESTSVDAMTSIASTTSATNMVTYNQ